MLGNHKLKKYQKQIERRIDDYMLRNDIDIYEFAYLCKLDENIVEDVYFNENAVNIIVLAHISSCLDALESNRWLIGGWEIIK